MELDDEREFTTREKVLGSIFCIGTIAIALWTMKKISESANNEKISWGDWINGRYGQKR